MTRIAPHSVLLPAISGPTALSAGVDIAAVDRIRTLLAAGNAFCEQVFRPAEIAYCTAFRDPAPHFAARFGAKEATLKALRLGLGVPPATRRLRDIEVCRTTGAPHLLLHHRMATLARRRGLTGATVSLSHDGDYALAWVLLAGQGCG
ncbi:holo-ACP synthase [Nocardia brasiliensis]|uniref:Holo-[acyl-carrier-protein] synthase n=1 Tax=Nocardia brasiliensis (strain ATCC 700358 / HUJEG-1) TaxID=1133849 RepID=K0ETU1_NOCB7|nr:holo-ACP synthase [Nocardia brasiliensis]AFU03193.1 apo-ACP pantetheinephosphotransferase [Nocardia brasiliensis ATCC 700358]OCF86930.1 hypothetical protein AW168_28775 [Nocardia brasiliensis]